MSVRQAATKSATSRPVTAKTIAQRAGVHQTTVSLALRCSPRISSEVGERIRRIAKDMGYYPRAAGQIGVIVAKMNAEAALSSRIVGQVVDACTAKGLLDASVGPTAAICARPSESPIELVLA